MKTEMELGDPWPCLWCDEMVDYPAVVCEKPACQDRQKKAQETEDRLRNFVDLVERS